MNTNKSRHLRLILQALHCWLFAAVAAHANLAEPLEGYTGAPPESQNCSACHFGTAVNTTGVTLSFNPPFQKYVPGAQYDVSVTIPDSVKTRFGFSMVARDSSDPTFTAGTLAASGPNTKTIGASVGHMNAPTNTGAHTFTVRWTAPAAGLGEVVFYVGAVAGDGNSGLDGDFVYTKTHLIEEVPPPSPIVGNAADAGAGSLRNAVSIATPGDTITFAPNLDGGTITLGGSQILIGKNLTIDASSLANGVRVSGGGLSRVFEIASGSTVALRGLTVTKGRSDGSGGGGILNRGTLTVRDSTLSGNSTTGSGGAILNGGGNLTVTGSTISGNTAAVDAGGIRSDTDLSVNLTRLTNCTFTGNRAPNGGAIYNFDGRTFLSHCTVTGNTATSQAGGVASYGDNVTATEVTASIIAANPGGDVDLVPSLGNNSFTSGGSNLIGSGGATGDFNQTGDRTGVPSPLLGPLCDNGGPTKTMHPLPGSRAIDGGGTSAFTLDQRGLPRTVGSASDIGAVESGTNLRWATRVLGFSSQVSPTNYAAAQALGEPDFHPASGDSVKAWSHPTPDSQREFIELGYDNSTPINSVSVYETNNPGAVDRISVRSAITRQWSQVWSGAAASAGSTSRILTATFPATPFPVDGVRLDLNSPAVPGFNDIDAVSVTPASGSVPQPGLDAAFAARTILSNTVSSGGKLVPATVNTTSNGGTAIWQWTPAADGWYDINTFGSNFDTQLAAYEGAAANSLVWFAGNDDAFPGEFAADHAEPNRSAMLLPFHAGKTYQFAISGGSAGASGGSLRLTIRSASEPLPPAIETRTHPFDFPPDVYNAATALVNTIVPIVPIAGIGQPEPYVQVVNTRSAVWETVSSGNVTVKPFLGEGSTLRASEAHRLSSQPRLSSAVTGGFKNPPSESGPYVTVVSARYPHPYGGGHRAICTDLRAEGGQGSGYTQMPGIHFGDDDPAQAGTGQGGLKIDFQGMPAGNSTYGYTLKDSAGNTVNSAAGTAAKQLVTLDPGSYSISLNEIAGHRLVVAYEGDGTEGPGRKIPNIVENGNELVSARRSLLIVFPNSIDGNHFSVPNFPATPFLAVSELMVKSDMVTAINVKFVPLENGTDKIGYVDVPAPTQSFLLDSDVLGKNSAGVVVNPFVESAVVNVTNAAQTKVLVMEAENAAPLGRRTGWRTTDNWVTFRNFITSGDSLCFACHTHSFGDPLNTLDPVDGIVKIAGGKPRVPWYDINPSIPKTEPFEIRSKPVDAEPFNLGIIDDPASKPLNHRMPVLIAVNTGAPRRTTVGYSGRTWVIQQAAGSGYVPKIAIGGGNQLTLAPGTRERTVSFSASTPWSAEAPSDTTWIHVTGASSGGASGNVNLKLSFDPNPGGRPRFGTVRIGDQFLTVIQPIEPPDITSTSPLASPRGLRFKLKATNGVTYTLEHSETLGANSWVEMSETEGNRATSELTFDAVFPVQPARGFYRIKSTPAE